MFTKLKRRLMRRNKGGFTLAEVIVSCALLGILLLGMILFINPVLKAMQGEQTNARASVVASSIEHYITRSVRSTTYVKVFTNAKYDDTQTGNAIAENADLKAMQQWVDKPENRNIYEIQCISIRKVKDEKADVFKYKLYQEFFNSSTNCIHSSLALKVFDDCFYEGLFPEVRITRATNQYKDGTIATPASSSPSGSPSPSASPTASASPTDTPTPTASATPTDPDIVVRPGLEININIYDEPFEGCKGEEPSLVFSGYGLTELYMIANKSDKQDYQVYKPDPIHPDDDTATDIYIYYITRKTRPPATASPSPTPSPSPT